MQVDPIKPTLKAPGIKLLKLEYDKPLSSFGFKIILRRYVKGVPLSITILAKDQLGNPKAGAYTCSQLNLSRV